MVTIDDAKIVAEAIVNSIKPQLITVFGSVARENKGNDLDLLVVVADQNYDGFRTDALLQSALEKYYRRFDIEPFIIPASQYIQQFRSGAPFLNAVMREGRVLYMNDHVQQWLSQAVEELRTATYLAGGGFYRSACYHAEQSLEKFLKARLIAKGWDLERTHSIKRLLVISEEYGMEYDFSEQDIAFMDSIFRGRYPMEAGLLPQGEPDADDAVRAIKIVSSVLNDR